MPTDAGAFYSESKPIVASPEDPEANRVAEALRILRKNSEKVGIREKKDTIGCLVTSEQYFKRSFRLVTAAAVSQSRL